MSKFFRFVSPNVNYDFIGYRNRLIFVSALAVLVSIVLISVRGLNFGIDFSGGTEVQINFVACDEVPTPGKTTPQTTKSNVPTQKTAKPNAPQKAVSVCVKRSELKPNLLRQKLTELFPKSDLEVQPIGTDGTEFMVKFQDVSFVSDAQAKQLEQELKTVFVPAGKTESDLLGFRFRSEGGNKIDLSFSRALVQPKKKDAAANKDAKDKKTTTPPKTGQPAQQNKSATTQPAPGKTGSPSVAKDTKAVQEARMASLRQLPDYERIKRILNDMGLKDVQIEGGNNQGGKFEYTVSFEGLSSVVEEKLAEVYGKGSFKIEQVESVGPRVGKKLRNDGIISLLLANLFILIYIAIRFDFRYAPGAVVALIHDVLITTGVFAALQIPFDLTIIAALLTIVGYSLNDTIVVFDRIRENWQKSRVDFGEVMNRSVNETLSRTLLTSLTTFIAVLPIYLIGGVNIKWFAFAMMFGISIGTYSSIAIASPLVLWLDQYFSSKAKEEDDEQEAKRERRRRRRAGLDESPENT